MNDRNFDDIAEKFARNIYGTTKGALRQAILWQDLEALMPALPSRPLVVLDAGGGEGHNACRFAQLGHDVTLCDLSAEMVARAQRNAEEKGVSGNMHCIHASAQDIGEQLKRPVDLILFHAVLEWVADPQAMLERLWSYLAPGGVLSLMFYNANGLLMHTMVAGNLPYVQQGMQKRKKSTLSPDYPLEPERVYRWLEQAGWKIMGKTGVRVFHDYLRDKTQQRERFDELLALETRYCRQEPWISMGRYIHVIAQKPENQE